MPAVAGVAKPEAVGEGRKPELERHVTGFKSNTRSEQRSIVQV